MRAAPQLPPTLGSSNAVVAKLLELLGGPSGGGAGEQCYFLFRLGSRAVVKAASIAAGRLAAPCRPQTVLGAAPEAAPAVCGAQLFGIANVSNSCFANVACQLIASACHILGKAVPFDADVRGLNNFNYRNLDSSARNEELLRPHKAFFKAKCNTLKTLMTTRNKIG